jgi:hypothetical protein
MRRIDGRLRIFDGLTDDAVSEVKNVKYQAFTRQIRDILQYSEDEGIKFDLYVRTGARLSKLLRRAIDEGRIVLKDIP